MIEVLEYPPSWKSEIPKIEVSYVLIQKFDEEAYKKLCDDIQKALMFDRQFLPIVIDSFGGEAYSLFGMVDVLESFKAKGIEIVTICTTKAMSCGAILFSVGQRRFASPNATFLVHEVSSWTWGKNVDVQNDAKHTEQINQRAFRLLDENTGHKRGYWMNRVKTNEHADIYLTTAQSKTENLVTHVGIPQIKTIISIKRDIVV